MSEKMSSMEGASLVQDSRGDRGAWGVTRVELVVYCLKTGGCGAMPGWAVGFIVWASTYKTRYSGMVAWALVAGIGGPMEGRWVWFKGSLQGVVLLQWKVPWIVRLLGAPGQVCREHVKTFRY